MSKNIETYIIICCGHEGIEHLLWGGTSKEEALEKTVWWKQEAVESSERYSSVQKFERYVDFACGSLAAILCLPKPLFPVEMDQVIASKEEHGLGSLYRRILEEETPVCYETILKYNFNETKDLGHPYSFGFPYILKEERHKIPTIMKSKDFYDRVDNLSAKIRLNFLYGEEGDSGWHGTRNVVAEDVLYGETSPEQICVKESDPHTGTFRCVCGELPEKYRNERFWWSL